MKNIDNKMSEFYKTFSALYNAIDNLSVDDSYGDYGDRQAASAHNDLINEALDNLDEIDELIDAIEEKLKYIEDNSPIYN